MAKQPELDDFRVPFVDPDKKLKPFDLSAIDPSAKPFSVGSKEADRHAARRSAGKAACAAS